jgi:hypothetical protein
MNGSDSKWERYAVLGGFAFVILNVVGAFLPGSPPSSDDTPAEFVKYFKDHDSAIQAGQYLALVGTIGLAWWFGSLFRRMRAAEGGNPRLSVVALLGLALGGANAIMSGTITAVTAQRIDDIQEGSKFFFTFSMVAIAGAAAGVIIFLSAVCALNYRTKMFPAWTNIVGWLSAAGFVVGMFSVCTDSNAIAVIGLLSFLVWCVWIIAVSLFMWRGDAVTS